MRRIGRIPARISSLSRSSKTSPNAHIGATAMKTPLWNLLVIVAVFAIPFPVAWYLFFSEYSPEVDVGGALYSPAKAVPGSLRFAEISGEAFSFTGSGQWVLLQLLDSPCQADCQQEIQLVNSVHTRLHKNALLVRHATLGYDGQPPLLPEYGIAAIEPSDEELMRDWLSNPNQADARVWIIDPRGYTALSYARPLLAKSILSDLKVLLSAKRQ